jgi:hypothetical protein
VRLRAQCRRPESMATARTWLDEFVETLPDKPWFQFLSAKIVVPFWARRCPPPPLPGGPRPSAQPSGNLQRMMNLVMPLKDKSAVGRARAALAIAQNADEIFAGLDGVGAVHFARFLLIGDNLCMISVYDGDFSNYIRDFIVSIGNVFDAVIALVEGGEKVTPSAAHVDAFIDWIHAHDLFQMPDFPTDLLTLQAAACAQPSPAGSDSLRLLPRKFILQMQANPNVSLGGGYRAYPGFSAAQVRRRLDLGW